MSAFVVYNGGINVGYGPTKTPFLCLILSPVPAH